jgi:hypothetical protein
MTEPMNLQTVEFLTWIATRPRTYAETMEAWRSSCPRLLVWEDALAEGLVAVRDGRPHDPLRVTLTAVGEAALDRATAPR